MSEAVFPGFSGFTGFIREHRAGLLATTFLLTGDADRARRLLDVACARLCLQWSSTADPRSTVLSWLVREPDLLTDSPWEPQDRFRLDDRDPVTSSRRGILAELAQLPTLTRQAVVLAAFAGLSEAEAAAVLGREASVVRAAAAQGFQHLLDGDPARADLERLRAELWAVSPIGSGDAATDVAHARLLATRRRLRAGLAVAATVVAVVLVLTQVVGRPQTSETQPAPSVQTQPRQLPTPRPAPVCRADDTRCQSVELVKWTRAMSAVVTSHLDPDRQYFLGVRGATEVPYTTGDVWSGQGGALGFSIISAGTGTIEVFVQVASTRDFAVSCGELSGTQCETRRFMDGNRFSLTSSSTLSRGIEVQHRPDGRRVITVVARDSGGAAAAVPLGTGELMMVAQDLRLQLPPT